MFDNLRELSDEPLNEDGQKDINKDAELTPKHSASAPTRKKKRKGQFLGMTAQQRFLVAIMLMFAVCLIGTLAMIFMGKMSIF